MKRTGKTMGMIAMAGVVFIYGVSYISREAIGSHLNATSVLALQMAIMTLFFSLYNLISRKSLKLKKKDIGLFVAAGLFGTTFFHGLTLMSVNSLGATVSSLLYGFAAAFALLVEVVLFRRKKTKLGILSIILSIIGIVILMDMDLQDLASTNFRGYLLGLGSVVSWVVYCFLCDRIPPEYDQSVMLNYMGLIGFVTTVPFLFNGSFHPEVLRDRTVILNLLFLGLVNSSIAYFLNVYAIRKIGVTLSNLFLNFLPVVTILVSLVLYGTVPGIRQILGGLCIIASVFMLNKDEERVKQSTQNSKELTT